MKSYGISQNHGFFDVFTSEFKGGQYITDHHIANSIEEAFGIVSHHFGSNQRKILSLNFTKEKKHVEQK